MPPDRRLKSKEQVRIAAVIPCYRAEQSIEAVVTSIPDLVDMIICVNDASDDNTLECLKEIARTEPRLIVVEHEINKGVGGATVSGYLRAIKEGADILVKLDSDGQMDPELIAPLIAPIIDGSADYTKGNRFFELEGVRAMPLTRLLGNAGLSFITKLATGYWNLFDPTNGFTAIHSNVARILPLTKLHQRYFFESDLMFRLSTIRAVIVDVPMMAVYGNEISNLAISPSLFSFPLLHCKNLLKRIVYNYFLRGFSAASLSLICGILLALFGLFFGVNAWIESARSQMPATTGTVMLSALPLLIGFQLILSFLHYDVASVPEKAVYPRVERLYSLQPRASLWNTDM